MKRVLVIGDVMIDRYKYVKSTRAAAEADISVWDEIKVENRLGGAANVANNLKALGGDDVEVTLAGVFGNLFREGVDLIKNHGINTDICVGGTSMIKTRYVDNDSMKYILRSDNIKRFSDDDVRFFQMLFKSYMYERSFDAIVISDYDKGTLTDEIISCIKGHPLVVVDSKRRDLSMYKGFKIIKVNEVEYNAQVSNSSYIFENLFEYCAVTLGSKGTQLRWADPRSTDTHYKIYSENFNVDAISATDVTGCGDTHTAAMTHYLLKTTDKDLIDIRSAIRFANDCARKVVQKFGTSVI